MHDSCENKTNSSAFDYEPAYLTKMLHYREACNEKILVENETSFSSIRADHVTFSN